jgi:hypothetical protein
MFAINFDAGKHVSFALTAQQVETLISHAEVHKHALMIGLKNILQDCHASIVREDFKTDDEWIAAKRAKAEMKLGALMTGDIRVHSGERKPRVDDFTTAARKYVLSRLSKDVRKKLADMPDKGVETLDKMFAKNEAKLRPIIEQAIADAARKAKESAELAASLDLTL